MKIQVTEQDIAKGIRRSTSQCPIARAVRNALTPDIGVVADVNVILLAKYDGRREVSSCRLDTPESAERFIIDFDDHGADKVEPFEFALDIPKEFLK